MEREPGTEQQLQYSNVHLHFHVHVHNADAALGAQSPEDSPNEPAAEQRPTITNVAASDRPAFYTVAEAATMLRTDPKTIYRAIREDAFPAVRIRTRYVVPAAAIEQMSRQATHTGTCVDVAAIAAQRRAERAHGKRTGDRP